MRCCAAGCADCVGLVLVAAPSHSSHASCGVCCTFPEKTRSHHTTCDDRADPPATGVAWSPGCRQRMPPPPVVAPPRTLSLSLSPSVSPLSLFLFPCFVLWAIYTFIYARSQNGSDPSRAAAINRFRARKACAPIPLRARVTFSLGARRQPKLPFVATELALALLQPGKQNQNTTIAHDVSHKLTARNGAGQDRPAAQAEPAAHFGERTARVRQR